MIARMEMVVPDAIQSLQALGKAAEQGGVPPGTLAFAHLGASQIKGESGFVQ